MGTGTNSAEISQLFPELHPAFTSQEAVVEAHRCLHCYDAPCAVACPTHIDVPRFIKKISSGNLRGSAMTILDANILGASCARVCPVEVLCEGSCVMLTFNKKPIEIGRLQRHAMDDFYAHGAKLPQLASWPEAGRVACIGAGPASLACAAELRKLGFSATIFDRQDLAGGLNTYGVAEYKLRATDSLREVELVQSLGVSFRANAEIGCSISLQDLEQEFDTIFIGAGLGRMEPLGVPGDDLPHVVDALRFIASYKTGTAVPMGDTVAVIGAGNTAIDAAIAAKKLGAREVRILYRRGEAEMPAFHFEYEHALQEGVQFLWQVTPAAVHAGKLECLRMEFGEPDASGRRSPIPVAGSEFFVSADLVIPAVGQSRLMALLHQVEGLSIAGGSLVIDRPTGATGNPKYFAGGDCVNGGREVVDAVADGKRAARGIAASFAVLKRERTHG